MRTAGALTVLMALALTAVTAQETERRFEVASVRPSGPAGRDEPLRGGPPVVTPGRLTYQRTLFRRLLMDAYGVQRDQIKGPHWAIADANLFPDRNMGGTFTGGVARMRFRDYPLTDLVQQLSFALGVRIVDKTDLDGTYDFTLEFTPDENGSLVGTLATLPLAAGQDAPLNGAGPNPGQVEALPRVSSAMEQQLGLKLEASRIAADMLVIDHAEETPTDN